MTPTQIKVQLMYRQIRQADIAREQGVSRAAVTGVIHRTFRSHRIQVAIAEAIRFPYSEVWGEDGPQVKGVHGDASGGN